MRTVDHHFLLWCLPAIALFAAAAGCGNKAEGVTSAYAVYVCTETGTVFVGSASATPALNPATGRRTLMQGLYCPQCNRWSAAPPIDQLQRMPGGMACPKNHRPLSLDGPVPAGATSQSARGEDVR